MLGVIKIFVIFVVLVVLTGGVMNAQTTTSCFEIEGILVGACTPSDEGNNEIVQFLVGPNPLNTANMNVVWATVANPWTVPCQNASTAQKVAALNATIQACGLLLEPPGGILPANSKVLLIGGINFNPANISFANLTETYYVIFNCSNPLFGNFANAGTGNRNLNMSFSGTAGCSDQVTYDRAQLSPVEGASVRYSFSGTPTYVNNGCIPPIIPLSATWTIPPDICQNGALIDLNALVTGTPGGTWSGTGVNGGLFNPAGLLGQIAVLYTVGNATCSVEEEHFITVINGGDPGWTPPGSVCNSSVPFDLTPFITGTAGGTWSGSGVTGSIFDPAGFISDIPVTYTVGTGACSVSETNLIPISASASAVWNFTSASICASSAPINLNSLVTGTPGGTWSGPGVTGNSFSPTGLSGSITITYSVGSGTCAASLQNSILVTQSADASWAFQQATICSNAQPINLNGLITGTPGGTWSGNGVTGSSFSPAGLSGSIAVTYQVGTAPCIGQLSGNIQVEAVPSSTWLPPTNICSEEDPIDLNLLVTGTSSGTWTGTGVTDASFNPSGLSGNILITYRVGSPACQEVSAQNIAVTTTPIAPNVTGVTQYCNELPSALNAIGIAGSIFNWYDSPGLANPIQSGNQFTPVAGQSASYYVTQTNGICESEATPISVVFQGIPATPQTQQEVKYCTGSQPPLLTATGSGILTWYADAALSIALTTGNQYQPAQTGQVTFYITSTVGNCESNAASVLLSEEFPVTAVISPPGPFIQCREQPIQLSSSSAAGNLWSTSETSQQIIALAAGRYILTVTGFCNTAKDTVDVLDVSVVADFNASPMSGGSPLTVTFTNTSVNAQTYNWFQNGSAATIQPGVDQIFIEEGEYFITLIARNNEGCIDSITKKITVIPGDVQFLMPNSFTPNEDGRNDVFKVASFGIVELEGLIYTRWGELIYSWNGVDGGWNGFYGGQICQDGVYIYRITARDVFSKTHEQVGSVLLLH